MKKLVGFDLNGWADFAARNWQVNLGEDTEYGGPFVFFGGLGGAVTSLDMDKHGKHFIGGIQALLSPHGRGTGWGVVGAPENRFRVAELLEAPKENVKPLAAALTALAPGGKALGIMAIEDTPQTGEIAQEALLEAMRLAGLQKKLLVWRPVLAVLSSLKDEAVKQSNTIGVVSHCAKGFSTQVLKMRNDTLPTPERRSQGRLHECDLGLSGLRQRAIRNLQDEMGKELRGVHLDAAQSPCRMALGESCPKEILLRNNSDWYLLTPPANIELPQINLPETIVKHLAGCDIVLFDTPASGAISVGLLKRLTGTLSVPVLPLGRKAVANGALEAASRLQKNQPIYFDFLPQISTIIQDLTHARNQDLIPDDVFLRAGETYRSQKPAQFFLQAGTTSLSIFLKKENAKLARKASIQLPSPPRVNTLVSLSVEQAPASGRARLTLTSDSFHGPMVVDWEEAEEQSENWEAIINAQQPKEPTIPNRVVLLSGMDSWDGYKGKPGLSEELAIAVGSGAPDWNNLASKLSARPEGRYAVSSNGDLPDGLPDGDKQNLDTIIQMAEKVIRDRLSGQQAVNNHPLKFLTWLFHYCPEWVLVPMIEALEDPYDQHPFRLNRGATTLLLQGIGRMARRGDDIRKAFDYLLSIPKNKWKKDHFACAAFLLSRNDDAPMLLKLSQVETLAQLSEQRIRASIGTDYTSKFFYAPYLLVGLLRRRLSEPYALVAGQDPIATLLLETTEAVIDDMQERSSDLPNSGKYHTVLLDVAEELKGQSTNPDLLLSIEALTRFR